MQELSYDPYVGAEQHLAAEARRLLRAVKADDDVAVEACRFDFLNFLDGLLNRHLSSNKRWGARWVDTISGKIRVQQPSWIGIYGEAIWYANSEQSDNSVGGTEPVEFELELSPMTGKLIRYIFRLGITRHFESASDQDDDVGNQQWAFLIRRGSAAPGNNFRPTQQIELARKEPSIRSDNPDVAGETGRFIVEMAEVVGGLSRQLIRDVAASDNEAINVSVAYLLHYIKLVRGCFITSS